MTFDTAAWGWPQWLVVGWLLLCLFLVAALNGKPKLDDDGKPMRWSFPVSLIRTVIIVLVLAAGGFFRG